MVSCEFSPKGFPPGKIKDRARRADVLLNHGDAPGSMKHAQRKSPLYTRHLIVVELHRVNDPAAELVVARIRAENRAQKNAGAYALRMPDGLTVGFFRMADKSIHLTWTDRLTPTFGGAHFLSDSPGTARRWVAAPIPECLIRLLTIVPVVS